MNTDERAEALYWAERRVLEIQTKPHRRHRYGCRCEHGRPVAVM